MGKKIFISYAREDRETALRLFRDLATYGLEPWIDLERLLAGERWKEIIEREIRISSHFIALISKNSIDKRGFFQRELSYALDVLTEVPPQDVFVIPVRLDETVPQHATLQDLHWVDLFLSYDQGFNRILRAIEGDRRIAPPAAAREAPMSSLAGLWLGRTGRLVLYQTGTTINGDYDWKGSEYVAHLAGAVEGDMFRFRWWWDLSAEKGHGFFQIVNEGNTLEGRWFMAGGAYLLSPIFLEEETGRGYEWVFHRATTGLERADTILISPD